MFVSNKYIAFQLYYKAESAGTLLTCRNYDNQFISQVSTDLSVTTIQGSSYTVINSQASETVEVSFAYDFWVTTKISYVDIIRIQTALEATWSATFSTNVTITISYQQEYISVTG